MQDVLHWLCLALLCALLVVAAVGDARSYIISNRLNGAIALLAIPWWLTAANLAWPMLGMQAALAVGVFVVLLGLFAAGVMGGGDVKLLAALALWLPPVPFAEMFMIIAIFGGLLTAGFVVAHRLRRREGQPEIPYGIAISAGALLCFGEPLVKHFPG